MPLQLPIVDSLQHIGMHVIRLNLKCWGLREIQVSNVVIQTCQPTAQSKNPCTSKNEASHRVGLGEFGEKIDRFFLKEYSF